MQVLSEAGRGDRRPWLLLADQHEAGADQTTLEGQVKALDYQGQAARYFVTLHDLDLQAINPIDRQPFAEGDTVQLRVRADVCVLLDGDG